MQGAGVCGCGKYLEDTVAGGHGEDMTLVCLRAGWGNQRLVTPSSVLGT